MSEQEPDLAEVLRAALEQHVGWRSSIEDALASVETSNPRDDGPPEEVPAEKLIVNGREYVLATDELYAAPDLLAAAKSVLASLDDGDNPREVARDCNGCAVESIAPAEKLRAALAKAEGEE